MTTYFIHDWLSGRNAGDAAKRAYEASIPWFTAAYPPTLTPKFRNVEVRVPCPTFTDWLKTCPQTLQVPDGVDVTPHTYVRQTELIVGGDRNCTF